MKKLKKILSLFLVSIILLPTLVVGVQAEGPEKIYFKFIYNNYIPTKFLSGGNHEDVSLNTDDHWHGFQNTKRNEFDIPIEASANSGHKTISIFISQRKGTKISATLTSGNESKTFTIDSPKEKDIKLGKAMLKFEVYYGDTLHFMENRNEPNYVPFTEDLTVQVDFEIVNFEEFRQSYIDELHRTYSYPEKESLYEEGLKSAIKTAEKEFREAKNQEDIMKAAKKFFKFTTEDYEEQVAKWSDRRSQLYDKVYKKKSDGTYLFSKDMRDRLMDNSPIYSSIYNSYSEYYEKSFSDSMAEFDPYEKKVDVIVKKAEIKEKLKDHDENYEPIFTQEQKEEFERKIDAINDDDADAMEKLAKIEKDVDTIRDAKNATQEDKDAAKEEIGNLPNLSEEEKAPFIKKVDDAQTKGDVEKAVEDARNADDLKAYKEKAKEEIGNLKNLSDTEKDTYKGEVDQATDKPGVNEIVQDANAKDTENKELKEAKDKAKEDIKDLNLTPEEKAAAEKAIDDAKDKGEVDKAVSDAKDKAAANDQKDKELKEAKDKAK